MIIEFKRFPKIVCLCGSTRFMEYYQRANEEETLAGNIVVSVGLALRGSHPLVVNSTQEELETIKTRLDVLHFRKIDISDEVLILNIGGYIGESTRREVIYADSIGKTIRYWENEH